MVELVSIVKLVFIFEIIIALYNRSKGKFCFYFRSFIVGSIESLPGLRKYQQERRLLP